MPEFSVIIPLYNKGPYIVRTLNSVLAQTFQDFEVIVVDDGSTDDGADVVKAFYHPKIRLIQQENKGVSIARNCGIKYSRAQLIAFLDADDEWQPDYLETIFKLQSLYPFAALFAASYKIMNENGKIHIPKFKGIPSTPYVGLLDYFKIASYSGSPICSSNVCIKKTILMEENGFIENSNFGEDTELWSRIALKYKIAYSNKLCSIYHRDITNHLTDESLNLIYYPEPVVLTLRKFLGNISNDKRLRNDILEYISLVELWRAERSILKDRNNAKLILNTCKTDNHIILKIRLLIIAKLPDSIIFHFRKWKKKIFALSNNKK